MFATRENRKAVRSAKARARRRSYRAREDVKAYVGRAIANFVSGNRYKPRHVAKYVMVFGQRKADKMRLSS